MKNNINIYKDSYKFEYLVEYSQMSNEYTKDNTEVGWYKSKDDTIILLPNDMRHYRVTNEWYSAKNIEMSNLFKIEF
jgi:hypothetical protein